MKKISVFDTTISDYNLGNQIIMESVYNHLQNIFPNDFFFRVPYMEITRHTMDYLDRSDLKIFGGTNSLSGQMEKYRQWDITLLKSFRIKDVILMGIGWWQYEAKTSWYTKILLNRVLNRKYLHSVRDSHTLQKLNRIGITNAINTGCPTLWGLTAEHCSGIPTTKSENVVLTLTDYNTNVGRDVHILKVLKKNYNHIYFWIQGEGDLDYINQIKTDEKIILIPPNLKSFDNILNKTNVDYVGTRLHAGVRALQKQKRTMIIGIDNRAIEMGKDFHLPVLHQDSISKLEDVINSHIAATINLPNENISLWKQQFR